MTETAPRNLTTRARAYQLYAEGLSKAQVSRELGVTKSAVTQWARKDAWDHRLAQTVREAERAVDLALGDQIAESIARLRHALARRLDELERRCRDGSNPAAQISAIKLWLQLAGVKQGLPNPANPADATSLELIQDLTGVTPTE